MSTTPEDDRRFRRDVAIVLLLAIGSVAFLAAKWESLATALSPATFAATTPDGVFDVAAGTWDWASADSFCVKNPHMISFSDDRAEMRIAHRTPWTDSTGASHRVTTYHLQRHTASEIRGAIVGETRLADDSTSVVWDLVLTSPASYAWHRADWPAAGRTGEVKRCPPGTDSLVPPP
jgi:hypothetical protein